jgi:hypothetical protein
MLWDRDELCAAMNRDVAATVSLALDPAYALGA